MIKIVTDSTSYIPHEYLAAYDISIVSLGVVLNEKLQREVDINPHTFYEEMDKCSKVPTSSQPAPEEVFSTFERIVKQGDSILGIFLSSDMSGTFASAHLVKDMILEKYPDAQIELLDSRTNCMQLGYIAMVAAQSAKEGKSMKEVIAAANHVISNSRFLFTPDTLDYLKKGGRIGDASALFGTLLQIKPILTVQNGQTTTVAKVRTKKKAVQTIIDEFLKDLKGRELGGIMVHHINCPEEGNTLATKLGEALGIDVKIQSIGPVIGLHVGPGSIGIAYYFK